MPDEEAREVLRDLLHHLVYQVSWEQVLSEGVDPLPASVLNSMLRKLDSSKPGGGA